MEARSQRIGEELGLLKPCAESGGNGVAMLCQ
jgi:hypothetical protein